MADTPTYMLLYDGEEYPVNILNPPGVVGQVNRLLFDISFPDVDPFAAPYDFDGFTITEYQDGVATGHLVISSGGDSDVNPVMISGQPTYYMVDGYGSATAGFDGYVPCFAEDTLVATPDGVSAVQDLRPGTVVATTSGPSRVVWLGHRRATNVDVIRIRNGTLGATRDLIVSDDHALYVDGVLVPAGLLVDGVGIVRERREAVTLYHVELERHAILLAEGVKAESYIDTGNRRQFGNCPIVYNPLDATQDHCAELILAGTRLEQIRARLAPVPA